MPKKNTAKERALHRIRIIQGHLRAVEKMLEEDRYCVDIIHQSKAIQAALKKLDHLILSDHLKSCVINQIKGGKEKKTIQELLELFE